MTTTTKPIDERPAFFNESLERYNKVLRAFTLKKCKGNEQHADSVYTESVIDMLKNYHAYDPERAGFYAWARWRILGKISNMAKANKGRSSIMDEFVRVAGVHDTPDDGDGTTLCHPVSAGNQEDALELKMLIEKIMAAPYGDEFMRYAMGDTLVEIAGGLVSSQAINQRLRHVRNMLKEMQAE